MDCARAALNNPVSSARTQTFVAFHSLTLTVFTLAFQNYQLWQLPIPSFSSIFCPISFQTPLTPPFFVSKNLQKTNISKTVIGACYQEQEPRIATAHSKRHGFRPGFMRLLAIWRLEGAYKKLRRQSFNSVSRL